MSNSNILLHSRLVSFLKTTKMANRMLNDLDMLSDSAYLAGEKSFSILMTTKLDQQMGIFLQDLMRDNGISLSDPTQINNFFTLLKMELKKIHQLKLILSIEPTATFIDALFLWVTQNISNTLLVNIETNKDIIAGSIVIYRGLYKDYSFAPQINSYFTDRKQDVQKLLA